MAIDVEGCREIAYQSAWALAQGLPGVWEVSMAKAWVSDAYLRVCATAHQCHGAIGFTPELELQLYTRRARGLEQAYGDARFHRKLLAQALKA
jgi:alkylation response protein AidB-like acyl-CoA dehydrogenase